MKQKTMLLFWFILFTGAAFAQMDIPQSGRIRVDGNLNDWRRAEWVPLEMTIDGAPTNISNAAWSLAWDEDAVVYIAVQYDDADIVLNDGLLNTNAQDVIQVYVRGDTGSQPTDYAATQSSAQCYTLGLTEDQINRRIQLGKLNGLPAYIPVKGTVKLEGNHFSYEMMVTLYDTFDATTRHRSSESELIVGDEIGLDIAIIDIGKAGYAGILGENNQDKRTNANQIAEHTLDD